MGLDQYLYAKAIQAPTTDEYGDTYVDMGTEDVCWRKANHIHAFFLNSVEAPDECQPLAIPVSAIKALIKRCEDVLANPELAPKLLPTRSGFFFGGTDYDERYFAEVKDTHEALVPLLAYYPDGPFTYQASW